MPSITSLSLTTLLRPSRASDHLDQRWEPKQFYTTTTCKCIILRVPRDAEQEKLRGRPARILCSVAANQPETHVLSCQERGKTGLRKRPRWRTFPENRACLIGSIHDGSDPLHRPRLMLHEIGRRCMDKMVFEIAWRASNAAIGQARGMTGFEALQQQVRLGFRCTRPHKLCGRPVHLLKEVL